MGQIQRIKYREVVDVFALCSPFVGILGWFGLQDMSQELVF